MIGRRDRLDRTLRDAHRPRRSGHRRRDAGSACALRWIIRRATPSWPPPAASRNFRSTRLGKALGPPVDLLIRTGGERRLSDFLLWECAYAELVFSRTMWPDFGADDLASAVRDFHGRERRFGAVPPAPIRLREAWLD